MLGAANLQQAPGSPRMSVTSAAEVRASPRQSRRICTADLTWADDITAKRRLSHHCCECASMTCIT